MEEELKQTCKKFLQLIANMLDRGLITQGEHDAMAKTKLEFIERKETKEVCRR